MSTVSAQPKLFEDRRKEARISSILRAVIELPGGHQPIECQISNISKSGAKLIVENAYLLPLAFHLAVPLRSWNSEVIVKWRNNRQVGVEFASANTVGLIQRLDALEQEMRELRQLASNRK